MKISEIRKLLKNLISGDVYWDKEILEFYSVDASLYQIFPKIIVIPKSEKDVITTIKIANKNKISVTARGAGTGLVGNSLNEGIIIDLRNFDSINIQKNFVEIGAGVQKGSLDKALKKKHKFSAPNPSIGPYCAMGGIIGNNASGSKTIKYGSTLENLIEITFIDGKGKKIILPQNQTFGKKILRIAKKIDVSKFPKVSKNSCGYRLDSINSVQDAHKILAGSEGTLGIILSAKMKIRSLPKKRLLFVVEYQSVYDAASDCLKISKSKPSGLEFVDRDTLVNFDFEFKKNTKCLLFVEYDTNIDTKSKSFAKLVSGKISKKITKEKEIEKWWKYRDLALSFSLKSIKFQDRVPHIIEDATVPLEKLGELFSLIEKTNKKFHTKTIMYGHAGNGNIHVRIISKRKKIFLIDEISKYYFEHVFKLGGSITGEHGDGIARSWFIPKQYGPKNFKAFIELKKMLDPSNILNPNKITSHKKHLKKLEPL
ncbi:MAG: FAD-binding protein [Nitrosopumilaceae archaeon]|nr:FAD-binding protein [Nitrosopumilaceae archaeon]NIP09910.1 FAD-binding protein [Nitrosopumilaceae archaeon]NIS94681.1 FAD-binding protein [Nitrosopumilaceae archaeon]